jgi:hypothetical protein
MNILIYITWMTEEKKKMVPLGRALVFAVDFVV